MRRIRADGEPAVADTRSTFVIEKTYVIGFSTKYRRPGCVLIQALMGTVPSDLFHNLFPSEVWLAGGEREAPGGVADVRPFVATRAQLTRLSAMAATATSEQMAALATARARNQSVD